MSTATEEAIALERQFWDQSNSPEFFRRTIADGGLTVIEPMGVIEKEMAVQAAKQGDRWVDVEFTDLVANDVSPDCVVLAYHARAKKESDGTPYQGSIASTYVRANGAWQMAMTCHQPWKDS